MATWSRRRTRTAGRPEEDLGPIPGMGVVGKFPNTASWTGITALLQTLQPLQPLQTLHALQASKGRFFAFMVAGDRAADTAHQSCEARWGAHCAHRRNRHPVIFSFTRNLPDICTALSAAAAPPVSSRERTTLCPPCWDCTEMNTFCRYRVQQHLDATGSRSYPKP